MPESTTNLETCDSCGNVYHHQWDCPVCHEPNKSLPSDPGSTPTETSWTPVIIIIVASIVMYGVLTGLLEADYSWIVAWAVASVAGMVTIGLSLLLSIRSP